MEKTPFEGLICLSEVEPRPEPTVLYNRRDDTIDIFGGSTCYTRSEPYFLRRRSFATPRAALHSMAHVATKTWARSEAFLHRLAEAFAEALEGPGGAGRADEGVEVN